MYSNSIFNKVTLSGVAVGQNADHIPQICRHVVVVCNIGSQTRRFLKRPRRKEKHGRLRGIKQGFSAAFPQRTKALQTQSPEARQIFEVKGAADKSLGSQKFGKATIDCKFLNRTSKWGLVDGEPTGLLILKVTIAELADCKLKDATIDIVFGSVNTDLAQTANAGLVSITEDLQPVVVCGEPTESHLTKQIQLDPEVNVASFGTLRGLSSARTKELLQKHRWIVVGHHLPDDRNDYTRVKLVFQGNPDVDQIDAIGPVHTGIAIVHNKVAFTTCVEIEGRLRKGKVPLLFGDKYGDGTPTYTKIPPRHQDIDIKPQVKELSDWIKKTNTIMVAATTSSTAQQQAT